MKAILTNIKEFRIKNQDLIILGVLIFLISTLSYGFGFLTAKIQYQDIDRQIIIKNGEFLNKEELKNLISDEQTSSSTEISNKTYQTSGKVVGSKNSDKYHYLWCAGAALIKPENIVTYNSAKEAELA